MTDSYGFATPESGSSHYNAMDFIIRQIMGRMATCTLVKVVAVDTGAETVAIQPLVSQIDTDGTGYPQAVIYNAPYLRLQGGANAVIIDPVVGDMGIAIFASRDISTVTTTKVPGLPGSRRQFDMADAMYLGGLLNGTPTQFVEFLPAGGGINVTSPGTVTIRAPATLIDGDLHVTGSFELDGDGTIDGKDWATHVHSGVTTGSGDTGAPV